MKQCIRAVLLGEISLALACVLYVYFGDGFIGRGLPASPLITDAMSWRDALLCAGITGALFLALTIPLFAAPPAVGMKVPLAALLIVTALSSESLYRQLHYYVLEGGRERGLFTREAIQGVGIQFSCLAMVWGFWVKIRHSTSRMRHSGMAWMICFYFTCLSRTQFAYLGPF